MAKSLKQDNTKIEKLPVVGVEKAGDWRVPVVTPDGKTLYLVQINKTAKQKEEKEQEKYIKAGKQVYSYVGKEGKTAFLVHPDDLLKRERVGKASKVTAELKGVDLTKLTSKQLAAMQEKLAAILG